MLWCASLQPCSEFSPSDHYFIRIHSEGQTGMNGFLSTEAALNYPLDRCLLLPGKPCYHFTLMAQHKTGIIMVSGSLTQILFQNKAKQMNKQTKTQILLDLNKRAKLGTVRLTLLYGPGRQRVAVLCVQPISAGTAIFFFIIFKNEKFNLFIFKKFFYVNMCLWVCVYTPCTCRCLWRPEEDVKAHGTRFKGSFELSCVGLGTCVLSKSSMYP